MASDQRTTELAQELQERLVYAPRAARVRPASSTTLSPAPSFAIRADTFNLHLHTNDVSGGYSTPAFQTPSEATAEPDARRAFERAIRYGRGGPVQDDSARAGVGSGGAVYPERSSPAFSEAADQSGRNATDPPGTPRQAPSNPPPNNNPSITVQAGIDEVLRVIAAQAATLADICGRLDQIEPRLAAIEHAQRGATNDSRVGSRKPRSSSVPPLRQMRAISWQSTPLKRTSGPDGNAREEPGAGPVPEPHADAGLRAEQSGNDGSEVELDNQGMGENPISRFRAL